MNIKNFTRMSLEPVRYAHDLYNVIKNQRLSPVRLKELQEAKLKALLRHAYANVDYYRRLFDQAGVKPEDIHHLEDIQKIPFTTRKDLQSMPREKIVATRVNPEYCINLRTSGSTGMPLDIFCSPQEIRQRWLSYRRMYFGNGGKLTDREIIITAPRNFKINNWFQNHGILNIKYISLFDDVEKQLETISQYVPNIIDAYPSALRNLAIEIENRKIKSIKPRLIFTTAELLSETDRKFISSVFQAELFDRYASNEFGNIAVECRNRSGYHIDSDNVIVEFIKADGTKDQAGEEGEIVITSLNPCVMPFIRYRIGDIGVPSDEKCSCGNRFPLMKMVAGRTNDCIVLSTGKKITPYSCMAAMDEIRGINKYQVIHELKNKVTISIMHNRSLSLHDLSAKIIQTYQQILGQEMEIDVAAVCDITPEKTGKQKIIVSKFS